MDYISPESIVHMGSSVISGSHDDFYESTSGGIQLPFIPG